MTLTVVYHPTDPEAVDFAFPDEIARVCDGDDHLLVRNLAIRADFLVLVEP